MQILLNHLKETLQSYVCNHNDPRLIPDMEETIRKLENLFNRMEDSQQNDYHIMRAAVQAGNIAWWQLDLSDGSVVFNRRKVEMIGYEPEDFVHYQDFTSLLHPDDCENAMNAIREHLSGKKDCYSVTYRIKHKSGGYRWFHDEGCVVSYGDKSEPVYVTGLVYDVTEFKETELNFRKSSKLIAEEIQDQQAHLKKTEEELAEKQLLLRESQTLLNKSEETARALLNVVKDSVVLLTRDGKIVDYNYAFKLQFHFDDIPLIGRSIWELLPADTVENHRRTLKKVFDSGKTVYGMNNDEKIWHDFVAYPIFFDQKEVQQVALYARDISAWKNAEAALQKSEQRLRHLFDTMVQGVVYQDENGSIISANPAAERILGLSLSQMQGLTSVDPRWHSIHEDGSPFPGEEHPAMIALKTGKPVHDIVMGINVPERNEYRWILINAIPLFHAGSSKPYQVYATFNDITERKQNQDAIQKHKKELESTVSKLKSTQNQLIQQERLAAVGQLAAGIAHDFNNLLTAIIGYADLLQNTDGLDGLVYEASDHILIQGKRAAGLTRQILDFSRKSMRQPVNLKLDEFISEAMNFLRRTIGEDIEIDLLVGDRISEYELMADPTQLQQILTNLAINSRDAMPDGGKIEFKLDIVTVNKNNRQQFPDLRIGKWALMIFRDNGIGIEQKHLSQIFEPFFSTKEVGQGTGLGLAQVYGIVQQHEGHITVSSDPGSGTEFRIFLPVSPGSKKAAKTSVRKQIIKGNGEKILLVEDNVPVLNTLTRILKKLNYSVITAQNGVQGLKIFRKHKMELALVLSDIVMPEMNGMELARKIRGESPDTAVLLISGFTKNSVVDEELEELGIELLSKPFEISKISEVVNQAISVHV